MNSKFMAHQVMSLLTPTACQTVEQLKKLYTWVTPDGKEEEMDGLTILAIILNCIRPHYKVDMYLEIEKLKKETLEQHGNQVDFTLIVFVFICLGSCRRTHRRILMINSCGTFSRN